VKNSVSAILLSSIFVAVVGCNKENDRPAMQPASGSTDSTDTVHAGTSTDAVHTPAASARDSIAEARCAREERCENLGDNKKYSSMQDCMNTIRADWKDDLNARECPGGVDQSELSECLTAVRNEDCGNPFDTLSRVSACTTGQICVD
jgi:hypothetical protein